FAKQGLGVERRPAVGLCLLADAEAVAQQLLGVGVLLLPQQVLAQVGQEPGGDGGINARLLGREGKLLPQQWFCLLRPVPRLVEAAQAVLGGQGGGVVGPQLLLPPSERLQEERLGLVVLPLCVVQRRQVVLVGQGAGVVGPQFLLPLPERFQDERLG